MLLNKSSAAPRACLALLVAGCAGGKAAEAPAAAHRSAARPTVIARLITSQFSAPIPVGFTQDRGSEHRDLYNAGGAMLAQSDGPDIDGAAPASIAISADLEKNETEIELGIKTALAQRRVIDRVIVGNETQLMGFVSADQLNAYIRRVRDALPARIKVTTAEPWST